MTKRFNKISLSTLKITLIYLVVAALWIAFTDRILESYISDSQTLSLLQTYKGWFYVFVTSAGLFYLINKHDNQLEKQKSRRKKYQQQLEQRSAFVEKALDNLPIGVAVHIYDNGKADLLNKKFLEIYGWPEETLKNVDDFFQKVYPDETYRDKVWRQINQDIESGDPDRMHWQNLTITTQEGEEKIINAKNIPLYEQNLMIYTVMDVTDLKQTERELEKEKQRFKLVAETTSDAIWDLDLVKEELWWSKGFEEMFGYKRENVNENFNKWIEYVHPDDREHIIQSSEQALRSDARKWQEEYRLVKADGSTAYMIDRAVIIRDAEGAAIRMIGTMDDITEQKRAKEELLKSEEKYRHLFENNPQPLWIYDPDTLKFIEVNQAAIKHYGYTDEEFSEMILLDLIPEEDHELVKKGIKFYRGGKESSEKELVHLKKDGSRINVEVSSREVSYGQNIYRLVLINDITEKKRMQEKMIQSVLEGEDRERKRIAHELHDGLGQYLVAANMNFQSVLTDTDQLPEKRQTQFNKGLSFLKNALSETRSIAYNLMPKAISDYGLIAALENMTRDFDDSTDIEFQFDHNGQNLSLKNQVEINIYRIFQEIISNAVRHSECSAISMQLQLNDDTLTIVVEDDGIGAELDVQREDDGLGFRSIKTRVGNLRGSLNIQSEPGEGMKITIIIPNIDNFLTNGDRDG